MNSVVIDTDVASLSVRKRLPAPLERRLAQHSPCMTFVTLGELTKWTALRHWGPRRLREIGDWRDGLAVLPFDELVATVWGELQARAQRRGRPRPANDTWIAACCLVEGLPLMTLNVKDFADFAEHEGLRLITSEPDDG